MHVAIVADRPDPSVYAGCAGSTIVRLFAVEGADASVAQGGAADAGWSETDPDWLPM